MIPHPHHLALAILDGAAVGITVQNVERALVYANAAAAKLLGFATAEALLANATAGGMQNYEAFHPDGTPFCTEDLPSRAALRGELPDEVQIHYRARGQAPLKWAMVRAVPVRDERGTVVYALNLFREVSEQVREREQVAFLLRAVDELNSSLDYESTLAALTRMAVPMLADWCAVDLIADDRVKRVAVAHVDPTKIALVAEIERRYPPDPSAASGVHEIIRSGRSELVSEIPPEMIRAAAVDADHLSLLDQLSLRSYIGVPLAVRDKRVGAITFAMAESGRTYAKQDLAFAEALADRAALAIENARLFNELARAHETVSALLAGEQQRRSEAEEASRFADMFIGILAHDLRNPLNAVQIGAQLLTATTEDGPARKTIDRITTSGQRMTAMVSQLLDLARSRLGGGIPISRAQVDLGEIVTGVVDELRMIHAGREILVEAKPVWGAWDRDRLAQVASNLIANAIEHGARDQPVRVLVEGLDGEARMTVRNSGPEIPAEILPTLFDPYRSITTRGHGSKGLGLGLFIAQQIVAAHGGAIQATSGQETRFSITLPRDPTIP